MTSVTICWRSASGTRPSHRSRSFGAFVVGLLLHSVGVLPLECVANASELPRWTEFRGPTGQGIAEETQAPFEWSESDNIRWKASLPGKGWSSPVVLGDQIWMTSSITTDLSEEEKKKRMASVDPSQPMSVVASVEMLALCVHLTSGQLVHKVSLMSKENPEQIHALNSYASPTPVVEPGRVYCHFGANGTACVDTTSGKVIWRNQSLVVKHENGPGGSPILWNDLLIFHNDGSDQQYIIALKKETGEIAWKRDRTGVMPDHPQLKKAYGTPLIVEVQGDAQLISPAADWVYAYDPQSGEELWKLPYEKQGFSIVPRPVVGHGFVYICTSFMESELLAITLDSNPKIAWRFGKQVSKMPSPILVGDQIYCISDQGGVISCLDARTGEELWRQRLGGNFSSSPIAVQDRIYFSNQDGETTVIRAGKAFEKIAVNRLDGQIMASPAVVDRSILLRTDKALYRIQ